MARQGLLKKLKKTGGEAMRKEEIKEKLVAFILEKLRKETSPTKPFYFIRWSGLFELCRQYEIDLLKLIDDMASRGLIGKALIKKKLAIYLLEYKPYIQGKTKKVFQEFQEFLDK
jgi:hypothetical protein